MVLTSHPTIDLVDFDAAGRCDLLEAYQSFKFDVFLTELGWDRLPHDRDRNVILSDSHDYDARFTIALDRNGAPVGTIRGSLPTEFDRLYRAELYEAFLTKRSARILEGRIATINSVAVRSDFRGRNVVAQAGADQMHGRLADLLMVRMLRILRKWGALIVLLSTSDRRSAKVMFRHGFKQMWPSHVMTSNWYSSNNARPPLTISDLALIYPEQSDNDLSPMTLTSEQFEATQDLRNWLRKTKTDLEKEPGDAWAGHRNT